MFQTDLTGLRALVTGASSGFGAHFAMTLAGAGAHVILAARRADRLAALTTQIEGAGGSAEALALDVADAAAVGAAFERTGAVDIIVNNAGVAGASRALETSPEEWRWTYGVNVDGLFFVARAGAQKLLEAGRGGSIINIASITSFRPPAGSAAYASSKAAVAHLTKCLALDWARHDIRVNALAPGYFETDINRDFLASAYGQTMIRRIPQRRTGEMADLDGPLLLLASPASAYMTGTVIPVDGGHLCSAL